MVLLWLLFGWILRGRSLNVPGIYACQGTYKTWNYQREKHAVFKCNLSWVWINGGWLEATGWLRIWVFRPPPGRVPGPLDHNHSLSKESFSVSGYQDPLHTLITHNEYVKSSCFMECNLPSLIHFNHSHLLEIYFQALWTPLHHVKREPFRSSLFAPPLILPGSWTRSSILRLPP